MERPTYPQFRDMIRMFMDPIEDPKRSEAPTSSGRGRPGSWKLEALEALGRRRGLVSSYPLGYASQAPSELYISRFGATDYRDILDNLAKSVGRFVEMAKKSRHFEVAVVSIDEPSLGISPNVVIDYDDIKSPGDRRPPLWGSR